MLAAVAAACAGAGLPAPGHAAREGGARSPPARRADDLESRFQQARSLARQERYDEAEALYSQLLEASPANADFLLGMAQVRLWRGRPEEALAPLRRARRLAPGYEDVWRTQIQALLALGDPDRIRQAQIIRAEAKRRFPRNDWTFAQLDAAPPAAALPPPPAPPEPAPALESVSPPATPQTPSPSAPDRQERYGWEAGLSRETLSRGLPAWRSRYLVGEWRRPGRESYYGGIRETERYGLSDREIHLGTSFPAGAAATLQFEAGASDTRRILPARHAALQVHYRPAAGWSLGAGLRLAAFASGDSRVANFGIEHYRGAERFAYTLYLGGPADAAPAPSHRWQWSHYYGEADWLGLSVVRGRESEHTGDGFLSARVSGYAISGRHRFLPAWSLDWEAGVLRQGDFYTRRGLRLGLRHSF